MDPDDAAEGGGATGGGGGGTTAGTGALAVAGGCGPPSWAVGYARPSPLAMSPAEVAYSSPLVGLPLLFGVARSLVCRLARAEAGRLTPWTWGLPLRGGEGFSFA